MLLYFIKKNGNKVKGTEFNISSNKLINGITVPVVNSKKIFNLKEKFNFIILSQVLPHLISPLILIKKLKTLLFKKGGIYISQPNIESLAFKFFKKNWFHLDIPRHLYHFDEINFIQFMEKNNLLLIKKKSIEIDHIFFGWIQSFMNIFLKRNLLFEYLTFYKKKLFIFALIMIIILFFIFMPLSLILTLFETLNLIKPSIIEYYFRKK